MARPIGQFDRQRDRCLYIIAGLAQLDACFATDAYLGRRLGVSKKQVQRYLKDLLARGLIIIKTTPARKDYKSSTYYKKRLIIPSFQLPPGFFSVKVRPPPPPDPATAFDNAPPPIHGIAEQEAIAVLTRIRDDERRLAEERRLYDSMDPDKNFDHDALFAELQADLRAQGIIE
jgi:predicted transcriptional regulator